MFHPEIVMTLMQVLMMMKMMTTTTTQPMVLRGGATTNQDLVCFTSAIISCEKGGQWQQALSLFDAMQLSDLQLDTG